MKERKRKKHIVDIEKTKCAETSRLPLFQLARDRQTGNTTVALIWFSGYR